MAKYLSIDTEATGLEEGTHLIQLAFVPVDTTLGKVAEELAVEVLIRCPSFEELKPNLNAWVLEHNESLIRDAHAKGIAPQELGQWVSSYMESPGIKAFFGGSRPAFLGKSLSALDIPLMTRYLSRSFMDKYFHHHTLDVTCVARALVDSGVIPEGCQSTTKLLQMFNIRQLSNHTALSDAVDMGKVYLKLLEILHAEKTRA
jgi:oligoribonuclease (3'-5' exoribonuclease)